MRWQIKNGRFHGLHTDPHTHTDTATQTDTSTCTYLLCQTGIASSLKQGKEDTSSAGKGMECGLQLEDFNDFEEVGCVVAQHGCCALLSRAVLLRWTPLMLRAA